MVGSVIQFTFNGVPAIDTVLSFHDTLTNQVYTETFKVSRNTSGEVDVGGSFVDAIEVAQKYKKAFELDYNNTLLYNFNIDLADNTIVKIKANNANSIFSIVENNSGEVDVFILNNNPEDPFQINSITAGQASSACDYVRLTVNTQEQATNIIEPIAQTVTTNPFIFDTLRTGDIKVILSNGNITSEQTIYVPLLLSANFSVNVVNSPSNAAITVLNTFTKTPAFSMEYSLDGITWQSSNSFSGIPTGNYTMYIRDSIGCSTSLDFEVTAFSPNLIDYPAIAEISNLNAIRFKKAEEFTACGTQKLVTNTLSYEERDRMPVQNFAELVQKCDVLTTQIKTNYANISASMIDCAGNETVVTVSKKTENMNITDLRSAIVGSVTYNGQNYLGVNFTSGTTYDPITEVANGSYNLGENYPKWMNTGDYLNIEGFGWFLIKGFVYANNANQVVLDALTADNMSATGIRKITSVYNVVNFERYEFSVDFANLEGLYAFGVTMQDANFGTVTFLSEWQNVQEKHDFTHVIEYYNTVNNEINYHTGITFKIRIPYVFNLKWQPNNEQDIYVTDTNTVLLESKVREFYKLSTRPLPTAIAQKLVLALSQDRLFIDGQSYLMEGEPEATSWGATNKYSITATLVKADYVFESQSGSGDVLLPTGTPLAIDANAPGLLFVD